MENLVITFLGTNDYEKVNYYLKDPANAYFTPFPLVAYLKLNTFNLEKLKVKVFVTEEAEKKNLNYLKCELKRIGVNTSQIERVPIKKGSNENEIRENFETLAEFLEKGFEEAEKSVIVDFTFSLRSIPILGMIAVLYARALSKRRNSPFPKVEMIYGAYEIGGKREGRAPIFDLSSYFGLLELSLAVDEFVNYGTAERFDEIAKNSEGYSEEERKFAGELKKLLESIYLLRCPDIAKFTFSVPLERITGKRLFVSERLWERVKEEVKTFADKNSSEWDKAKKAVEWCDRHGLYAQGYTILREAIINRAYDLLDEEIKNTISSRLPQGTSLSCKENYRCRSMVIEKLLAVLAGRRRAMNELVEEVLSKLDEEREEKLRNLALKLYGDQDGEADIVSKYRNDINHCGWDERNRMEPEELREKLKTLLEKVKDL